MGQRLGLFVGGVSQYEEGGGGVLGLIILQVFI